MMVRDYDFEPVPGQDGRPGFFAGWDPEASVLPAPVRYLEVIFENCFLLVPQNPS
jgi:hypothetical protein